MVTSSLVIKPLLLRAAPARLTPRRRALLRCAGPILTVAAAALPQLRLELWLRRGRAVSGACAVRLACWGCAAVPLDDRLMTPQERVVLQLLLPGQEQAGRDCICNNWLGYAPATAEAGFGLLDSRSSCASARGMLKEARTGQLGWAGDCTAAHVAGLL
jgi:hypothetical protein